jgi:hypothetical protein
MEEGDRSVNEASYVPNWCEYAGGYGRPVHPDACAWHAEKQDPACRACEVFKRLTGGGGNGAIGVESEAKT